MVIYVKGALEICMRMVKLENMRRTFYFYLISFIIFLIDQITKLIAVKNLKEGIPLPLNSFFDFTLIYNTGAAFSILANNSGWQKWFLITVTSVISIILCVMIKRVKNNISYAMGLSLILGGAIGNLYDRLLFGKVTDFLSFHLNSFYWPAFNVADSSICCGAFLLIYYELKESFFKKKIKQNE